MVGHGVLAPCWHQKSEATDAAPRDQLRPRSSRTPRPIFATNECAQRHSVCVANLSGNLINTSRTRL